MRLWELVYLVQLWLIWRRSPHSTPFCLSNITPFEEGMAFTHYAKNDPWRMEHAPEVCGCAIGKTGRTCGTAPTYFVREDNQWTCGRHLAKALEQECAVCMCKMSTKQEDRLPCGHVFHSKCLSRWEKTSKNTTCPLCRAAYEYLDDSSEDNASDTCDDDDDVLGLGPAPPTTPQANDGVDAHQFWIHENLIHQFIDLTI